MPLEMYSEPYVCVIGAASVDLTGHSHGAFIAEDSNPGSLHISWGGVGRNIAENLARLDTRVHLVTVLGDDHFSGELQDHAADCGIDMHARIIECAAAPAYLCINDASGEMVGAVAAMELLDQLDEGWIQENAPIIDGATLCVIDANLDQELIGYLLDTFPGQDFFVDTVSMAKAERIMPWIGRFAAVKMNRDEAGYLSGISVSEKDSLLEAAAFFLAKGVRRVVISLGVDGLFYADSETCGSLQSVAGMKTINATGSGDALMAGLAAATLQGLDLEEAAHQAMVAAKITLQHKDAVNPKISLAALHELREDIHHA
jgi:pseudouridine kinase